MKTAAALVALAFGITTSHVLAQLPGSTPLAPVFESGDMQTTLIELFTSEGCSSCPPADEWISQLKDSPDLWTKIVPVAFHIDYWDNLGWRDHFAKPEFTARQRQYVATWRGDSVYTPGFVVNGREWRDWHGNRAPWRERSTKAGNLRVTLSNETDVTAIFTREGSRTSPVHLYVALLGSNLESNVKGGENSGRKLRHDFVVLQLAKTDLIARGSDRWIGSISLSKQNAEKPRALAAWVSEGDVDLPIQATGGWLTSPLR
jgi:hypothetical protein